MTTVDTKGADVKELRPLKEETILRGDIIAKEIVIDAKTGTGTITADTYKKLATEAGIDLEAAEKKQIFDTSLVSAATYALGTVSAPIMAKNVELKKTDLVIPLLGKDTLDLTYTRSEEVSNGIKDAEGAYGRKEVYGQTTAKFKIYATGNRGELSKVKEHLGAAAAALFS